MLLLASVSNHVKKYCKNAVISVFFRALYIESSICLKFKHCSYANLLISMACRLEELLELMG